MLILMKSLTNHSHNLVRHDGDTAPMAVHERTPSPHPTPWQPRSNMLCHNWPCIGNSPSRPDLLAIPGSGFSSTVALEQIRTGAMHRKWEIVGP